ncbi:MAG TPA: NUDIX domain-containing protein [Kineosporiaceae bacterium]|nr:NUDIX domain-containing protein [Kineosporiaceae bacterium]
MQWQVHGRRGLYASEWVELWLDDVEIPGGNRFDHHVLRFPRSCVSCLVVQDERALLLWRHRFITDTWGWEVPGGWVDPGEDPAEAARREVEEETGWRPRQVERMTDYTALNGIGDLRYGLFLAEGADRIGEPEDVSESSELAWLPLADLPGLIRDGRLTDGPTLLAVGYYLGIHRTALP